MIFQSYDVCKNNIAKEITKNKLKKEYQLKETSDPGQKGNNVTINVKKWLCFSEENS